MKRIFGQEKDRAFIAILAVALLLGIFLRSYLLSDQVLIDDEWHGFFYAIGKSPFFLLTHFSVPGATCIPLNFYTWLLGHTVGWSETLLRLPSLICGVLCVLLCPLLAQKIIGTQRAAWLALLLAISPLLIFYSRICRP
ncbi:MAG TPA: glycosyltransferase family 39 protein, partial [Verrucomicrobiae bacterium]|nr:glycosyltransferase family 39 protein [Verrucomicrobiae bacterium]